jgi:hypothetical protein
MKSFTSPSTTRLLNNLLIATGANHRVEVPGEGHDTPDTPAAATTS